MASGIEELLTRCVAVWCPGAAGVIGPTRMDYAKLMPLVDATANALSEALARGNKT